MLVSYFRIRAGPLTSGFGGAEGIRTPDLLIANETRYQLRHSPKCEEKLPPRPTYSESTRAFCCGAVVSRNPHDACPHATTPLYMRIGGRSRQGGQPPAARRCSASASDSTSAAASSAVRASSLSDASWPEDVMPVISIVRTVRRARALLT